MLGRLCIICLLFTGSIMGEEKKEQDNQDSLIWRHITYAAFSTVCLICGIAVVSSSNSTGCASAPT